MLTVPCLNKRLSLCWSHCHITQSHSTATHLGNKGPTSCSLFSHPQQRQRYQSSPAERLILDSNKLSQSRVRSHAQSLETSTLTPHIHDRELLDVFNTLLNHRSRSEHTLIYDVNRQHPRCHVLEQSGALFRRVPIPCHFRVHSATQGR